MSAAVLASREFAPGRSFSVVRGDLLARDRGWESISFPAVSSGIFAVPAQICSRAYVAAARRAPLSKLRLCLRDQSIIDTVLEELEHGN